MAEKLIKVRLGENEYLIPQRHKDFGGNLIRITEHPLNSKKVLVWRERKEEEEVLRKARLTPSALESIKGRSRFLLTKALSSVKLRTPPRSISVYEAAKGLTRIEEGKKIANVSYHAWGKNAFISDFTVDVNLRRKNISSGLLQSVRQNLERRGIRRIFHESPHRGGFYQQLSGKKTGKGPGVLWQRLKSRVAI